MSIINLDYPIHIGMFKYPGDPEVEIVEAVQAGFKPDGKVKSGYVVYKLKNHHATHVDAPAHKLADGKTIDQYLPEKFINKALLIDLTDRNLTTRENKGVTLDDLIKKLDFTYIKRSNIAALLFYTGYCDRIAEKESKLESEEKTAFEKEFTYFTPDAANYVASNAPFLNIVGIDSFAFDPSGSNSESHIAFFKKDILLLETAVNLAELKKVVRNPVFELNCVPLLYKGADAAQTRAYAKIGGG